jgi:hypothetical protein
MRYNSAAAAQAVLGKPLTVIEAITAQCLRTACITFQTAARSVKAQSRCGVAVIHLAPAVLLDYTERQRVM